MVCQALQVVYQSNTMAWGILIGVFVWGMAAFGAIPDKEACASYLAWLDLQGKAESAQARAHEPGISDKAKAYWEREFSDLHAQLMVLKEALLVASTKKGERKALAGSHLALEAASTETLPAYHTTRPAGNHAGAKVVRLSNESERMLVIPGQSLETHLWDVKRNTFWILKMENRIVDAAFDWNGNVLALDSAGNLALFAADGRRLNTSVPHNRTDQIALSSKQLLCLAGELRLTDELTYTHDRVLKLPPIERAHFLRISADAQLAAVSFGRTVHLIDVANGARLRTFPEFNPSELVALEFAPDSHRLVGLSEEGSLSVWDPDAMGAVTTLQLEHLEGLCLALDAEGNAFVGGSQNGGLNGAVVIVDLEAGEELRRFNPEHEGGVGAIGLSPSGKILVTTAATSAIIRFHQNPLVDP